METKTSKAVALFKEGKHKEALAIFSNFKLGLSKEEQRILKIAHEIMAGNVSFYEQIGIDTTGTVEQAKEIINSKY